MNEKYKISDEALLKVLYSSPMLLPTNPSEKGFGTSQIKAYFYKFIEEIIKAVNAELSKIENDFSDHAESSYDITASLNEKDTELGKRIQALNDGKVAKSDYESFLEKNKENTDALVADVAKCVTKEDISLSKDESGLKYALNIKGKTLYIDIPKDRFLKSVSYDKAVHILKFVFETGDGDVACNIELADLVNIYTAGDGITLSANAFSVDDTIARKTELEKYVSGEAFDGAIHYLEGSIAKKEGKRLVSENSAEAITMQSSTEYNCGLRTSIILNLPSSIGDFECIVNFKSGAIPTAFDSDARIIYTQDDTLDGTFYPVANRIYEINIKSVMGALIAVVNGTDEVKNEVL